MKRWFRRSCKHSPTSHLQSEDSEDDTHGEDSEFDDLEEDSEVDDLEDVIDVDPLKLSNIWVQCQNGGIPSGAVWGGTHRDGDVYIGRRKYYSELLPVNIVPNNKCGYVCTGWRVYPVNTYEVLCHQLRTWVYTTAGSPTPDTAIKAGYRLSGSEALYVGRVVHNGYITPGKVEAATRQLHIPFDDDELVFNEYEILCTL